MKEFAAAVALIDLLRSGQPIEVLVAGESMYPALKNGDVIRINPLSGKEYPKKGDIVAIDAKPGRLIVHRLIRFNGKNGQLRFFIKGDAKLDFDPPCKIENILGRVIWIKRKERLIKLTTLLQKKKAYIIARVTDLFPIFSRIYIYIFRMQPEKSGN